MGRVQRVAEDQILFFLLPTNEVGYLLIMSNFESIDTLQSWAINYQDTCNPWTLYCDLIGYSKDRYGENLNSKNPTLGYIELTQLSDALSVFNGNGYDAVYEYMDKLINSEDEDA